MQDISTPPDTTSRYDKQRFLYALLFFVGSLVAFVGWFVDLKHLERLPFLFKHAAIIAAIGHAVQVVALLGFLLLPDWVEEEAE